MEPPLTTASFGNLFGAVLFLLLFFSLIADYIYREPRVRREVARAVIYSFCFLSVVFIFSDFLDVDMFRLAFLSFLSVLASMLVALLSTKLGLS